MPSGFLFDTNRCTGCQACELGCTIENELPWGSSWRQVSTFNAGHAAPVPLFHLSLACHHCEDAPCMRHCPALAIRRRPETGAVLIDADRCIGCGYCSWACPFDAPAFDARRGVMTKCTLCDHRLDAGLSPACVAACPTGALGYGALDPDWESESLPGFPRTSIGPRIQLEPLAPERRQPDSRSWTPSPDVALHPPIPQRERRAPVNLVGEWPLLLFTLSFACLVAAHAGLLAAGRPALAAPFFSTTFAAMLISTLHLGRRSRAWRAVWNIRHSWLSREIAAFGAFAGLAAAWHIAARLPIDGPAIRFLPWATLYAGLLGLYSADRVYDLARPTGQWACPHSASVLWTGTLGVALLLGSPWAAAGLLGFKLTVFLRRRLVSEGDANFEVAATGSPSRHDRSVLIARPALSVFGFVLWLSPGKLLPLLGLALILGGEIVDRIDFYQRLTFMSPRRQIAVELRRMGRADPQPT